MGGRWGLTASPAPRRPETAPTPGRRDEAGGKSPPQANPGPARQGPGARSARRRSVHPTAGHTSTLGEVSMNRLLDKPLDRGILRASGTATLLLLLPLTLGGARADEVTDWNAHMVAAMQAAG